LADLRSANPSSTNKNYSMRHVVARVSTRRKFQAE
jgi:hypothetical protein